MPCAARRGTERAAVAAAAAMAALLCTAEAFCYCRTSACGNASAQVCTPPQPDDCGKPLFWPRGCFGYSVQEDGSRQVSVAVIESLMGQAFAAWTNAPCPDGTPSLQAINLGTVSCDRPEYNQESGNANVIMFRDDAWPYSGQGNTLALTTVTFNLDDGAIYDTDLEVNGTSELTLTTGDANVQYDLLSILTHEAGHMLGLSHSAVPDATMKIDYVPGDIELRSLEQDDVDAICAVYPPNANPTSCDPTPRHGFQSECGSAPLDDDGCSCAVVKPRSTAGAFGVALLVALASLRRRRTPQR